MILISVYNHEFSVYISIPGFATVICSYVWTLYLHK